MLMQQSGILLHFFGASLETLTRSLDLSTFLQLIKERHCDPTQNFNSVSRENRNVEFSLRVLFISTGQPNWGKLLSKRCSVQPAELIAPITAQ